MIFITGKSGSGKSTIAQILSQRLGYKYIDVDSINHTLYNDEVLKDNIVAIFGHDILDSGGRVIRKVLGTRLFNEIDNQKIDLFNTLTQKSIENSIDKEINKDTILDWVLLPLSKYWGMDSVKVLVEANEEKRIDMIANRDDISKEYILARDSHAPKYKAEDFDIILYNDYSEDFIDKAVENILKIMGGK